MSETRPVEYRTAGGDTPAVLDAKVTAALADGWRPYGSPYSTPNGYYQALVRGRPVVTGSPPVTAYG